MAFEEIGGAPEYFNEEWETLKQRKDSGFFVVKKGREIGVPDEEIEKFAQDFITQEIEKNNYGPVYRFMKNAGIGTEEEIRATGEQAYNFYFNAGDFISAISIAKEAYGTDSEEWRRASEALKTNRERVEEKRSTDEVEEIEGEGQELEVIISKNATFADLFMTIDSIEEKSGLGGLHFAEELEDNFNPDIIEEVISLRSNREAAENTSVLDFFEERGYSQSDVSAFLPIKFE